MDRAAKLPEARIWALTAAGATLVALSSALGLKVSEDTLTDRVAVDTTVFNQRPRDFTLAAGNILIHLTGPEAELDRLRQLLREDGVPPKPASGESSLDYSLRAVQFVQAMLRFGPEEEVKLFRNWGFETILTEASRGRVFFCDTYARLLAAVLLAEGIPARSVWMKGHVTTEIFSTELDKWVMVDAMYNHYMVSDGVPLAVLEIREFLGRGVTPEVVLISDPHRIDEPSRSGLTEKMGARFLGPTFKVFDSDITFERDLPHLILPAMSLATRELPTGTTRLTGALRYLLPLSLLTALLSFSLYRRQRA